MEIAVLLFPGVTLLDAIGPYEVLRQLPGATVRFVAAAAGPVRADSGASLVADTAMSAATTPDVVVVPGGPGTRPAADDVALLGWIRRAHETSTWTTSVCTGSHLLAAAGVLSGVEATGHWASLDVLADHGAVPVTGRVVERGRIMTAAGVSAGIDMALLLAARLAGEDIAKAIQLGIEYDPQPPFGAGSPATAPPEIVDLVRAVIAVQEAESSL